MNYLKIKHFFNRVLEKRKKGLSFLLYNLSGNFFTFSLNLFLPFFISINDYGYFAIVFSLHNVLINLFTFGFDLSILKYSLDSNDKKEVLYNIILSWLKVTLIIMPVALLSIFLIDYFKLTNFSYVEVLNIYVSALVISLFRIVLMFYVSKSETGKYGQIFVSNKLIQLLAVFGIILLFNDIKYISFAFLVQGGAVLLILLYHLKKMSIFELNRNKLLIKNIAKFTWPLSINTFGSLGYNYGFNLFISPFLSLSEISVLNIFTQFGTAIRMILNALNDGYLPTYYEKYKANFKEGVQMFFKYILNNSIIILSIFIVVGVIYKYLGFKDSVDYTILNIIIFMGSAIIYNLKAIGTNSLLIEGKSKTLTAYTLIATVTNILIGFILVKYYGFMGCLLSLFIASLLQAIIFNKGVLNKLILKK